MGHGCSFVRPYLPLQGCWRCCLGGPRPAPIGIPESDNTHQRAHAHTRTRYMRYTLLPARAEGPGAQKRPNSSSLTRRLDSTAQRSMHTVARIMHFCLTWPLTAAHLHALWPLSRHDRCQMSLPTATPTPITNCPARFSWPDSLK
jgi:hypothetical protein